MEYQWGENLGYNLEINILTNGWYTFPFSREDDVSCNPMGVWICGCGKLMLQHWYVSFDPRSMALRYRHLWVMLLDFQLEFWNLEAFRAIGNMIGKLLYT